MDNQRTLKLVVLLVGALAVVTVLFFGVQEGRQVRISTQTQGLMEGGNPDEVEEDARVLAVLKDVRYGGGDGVGNMWEVTAAEAVQMGGRNDQTLALQHVTARWEGGDVIVVRAGRGMYEQISNTLNLAEDVTVEGAGLTLTMPAALADLAAYKLESTGGDVKVVGLLAGYNVTMTADVFDVRERGNLLRLRGKVRGVMVE